MKRIDNKEWSSVIDGYPYWAKKGEDWHLVMISECKTFFWTIEGNKYLFNEIQELHTLGNPDEIHKEISNAWQDGANHASLMH